MGRLIDIEPYTSNYANVAITYDDGNHIKQDYVSMLPTVEAIPKDQYDELKANITMMQLDYNARLKSDMVAMLEDLKVNIEAKENYYEQAFKELSNAVHEAAMGGRMFGCGECKELVQQKINSLKESIDVK